MDEYSNERADLILSSDVIYHFVEQEIFEAYMIRLFGSSDKYVMIYSSNMDNNAGYEKSHIKLRQFTRLIKNHLNNLRLIGHLPNNILSKVIIEKDLSPIFASTRS